MNKKKVLLSGSLAYDHLLHYKGKFQDNLNLDVISAAFPVESKTVHFGGCAGNIGYGLNKLDVDFDLYSALGSNDADIYLKRLKDFGISTNFITIVDNQFSATAYICTDDNHQQLTFFYPGSSFDKQGDYFTFPKAGVSHYDLALISPNATPLMLEAFHFAKDNKIPVFFDPGQQLARLDDDFLIEAIKYAEITFFNFSEFTLLLRRLNIELDQKFMSEFGTFIITDGANPVLVYDSNKKFSENPVRVFPDPVKIKIDNPTGCGDAFRAGFIYYYLKDEKPDLLESVVFANKIGSLPLQFEGSQDYMIPEENVT